MGAWYSSGLNKSPIWIRLEEIYDAAFLIGQPDSQAIQIKVNNWRRVERKRLRKDQAADNRDAQRLAQLATDAGADSQRQAAEHGGHGGHGGHGDRPEAKHRGLKDRIARALVLCAFGDDRKVD